MYSGSRHVTPPAVPGIYIPGSGSWYDSDAISACTHDSPESLFTTSTARTTPPRSPPSRHYGSILLPKVRQQDQVTEPAAGVGPIRHHRKSTSGAASFQSSVFPYTLQRPRAMGRGISPSRENDIASPAAAFGPSTVSAGSPSFSGLDTALTSPITFDQSRRSSLAQVHQPIRASSAGPVPGQAHTASAIDELLGHYAFPTGRSTANYITSAAYPASTTVTHVPDPVMAFNSMPTFGDEFNAFGFDSFPYPSTTMNEFDLPMPETSQINHAYGSTSIFSQLTLPNPSPALVRRLTSNQRATLPHFWFDIRNLRQWRDFDLPSITSVPDIYRLIHTPVSNAQLPTPPRPSSLAPDNESQLHDIFDTHFCSKINSALQVAQGPARHMVMRSTKSIPNVGRGQPDFISNYPLDAERTFQGDLRGRVVGLVKGYDAWNTGMRAGSPPKLVEYLRGLAHLHRVMREHGCRYGFIINEIELLCVRAGGLGSGEATRDAEFDASTPIFGFLELSPPVQLSEHAGANDGAHPALTVGLALWYLHMLAKDGPLPGAGPWRLEVGGPIARTRANCIDKDAWVPKPSLLERREAKRQRGWIWPEDPYHKKESGPVKKRAKST